MTEPFPRTSESPCCPVRNRGPVPRTMPALRGRRDRPLPDRAVFRPSCRRLHGRVRAVRQRRRRHRRNQPVPVGPRACRRTPEPVHGLDRSMGAAAAGIRGSLRLPRSTFTTRSSHFGRRPDWKGVAAWRCEFAVSGTGRFLGGGGSWRRCAVRRAEPGRRPAAAGPGSARRGCARWTRPSPAPRQRRWRRRG